MIIGFARPVLWLTCTAMGNIPSTGNMISAVMVSPQDGDTVPANQAMTFSVKINNLVAG